MVRSPLSQDTTRGAKKEVICRACKGDELAVAGGAGSMEEGKGGVCRRGGSEGFAGKCPSERDEARVTIKVRI